MSLNGLHDKKVLPKGFEKSNYFVLTGDHNNLIKFTPTPQCKYTCI